MSPLIAVHILVSYDNARCRPMDTTIGPTAWMMIIHKVVSGAVLGEQAYVYL
jgi:hypothetical protein